MLLYLAFSVLLLGTSLVTSHPSQTGQQRQENAECGNLLSKIDALQKKVDDLNKAFFAVHNARSFASGSEKIYVTNEREGNFGTANAVCLQHGGHLPFPKKDGENQALLQVLKKRDKSTYVDRNLLGNSQGPPEDQSKSGGNDNCVAADKNGRQLTSCEEARLIVCEFSFVP